MNWHLQKDRCKILFPALKQMTEEDLKRWDLLLDNTNPEENFHRQFRHLLKSRNVAFGDLINHICHQLKHLDSDSKNAEAGITLRHGSCQKGPKRGRPRKKKDKRGVSRHKNDGTPGNSRRDSTPTRKQLK